MPEPIKKYKCSNCEMTIYDPNIIWNGESFCPSCGKQGFEAIAEKKQYLISSEVPQSFKRMLRQKAHENGRSLSREIYFALKKYYGKEK